MNERHGSILSHRRKVLRRNPHGRLRRLPGPYHELHHTSVTRVGFTMRGMSRRLDSTCLCIAVALVSYSLSLDIPE